jgi:hypothetical protein
VGCLVLALRRNNNDVCWARPWTGTVLILYPRSVGGKSQKLWREEGLAHPGITRLCSLGTYKVCRST